MQDQIVTFATAKLAKKKQFDGQTAYECVGWNALVWWCIQRKKLYPQRHFSLFENMIKAPTQSLLQKWLREKHLIIITIDYTDGGFWDYRIKQYEEETSCYMPKTSSNMFQNYEEALEEGLKKALKGIKI